MEEKKVLFTSIILIRYSHLSVYVYVYCIALLTERDSIMKYQKTYLNLHEYSNTFLYLVCFFKHEVFNLYIFKFTYLTPIFLSILPMSV